MAEASSRKCALKSGTSGLIARIAGAAALGFAATVPATAFDPGKAVRDVGKAVGKGVQKIGKGVQKTGKAIEKGVQDTGKTLEKTGQDTGKTGEKAAHDTGKTLEKTGQDTGKTGEKAAHDTGKATEKAGQDVVQAGVAIAKYVERQVQGVGDTLSDAEKRLREGKVVDALWHAATDPYKHTEKNAAKAAQESEILATVGQVTATAYGGPGGAAAYAAWLTYRQTGDMELAIKIGLITGAASAGFSAAGQLPSDTAGELAKKTILTGAIGGAAVAAAGGDQDAVRDGFLRSGGMVIVQDGYRRVTTHNLDPKASEGAPYCMASVGAECSPPKDAYVRDANGNIAFDEKGNPKVDVTKTDPKRPHAGTWSKAGDSPVVGTGEQSGTMVAVSKVPGMNALAVFHDQWSVSWDMDAFTNVATIVPAVVITYTGTGAPAYEHIQRTGTEGKEEPVD